MNLMSREDALRAKLEVLSKKHRALDAEIAEAAERGGDDTLSARRLKKRKLSVKDEISHIIDSLYPDIIA